MDSDSRSDSDSFIMVQASVLDDTWVSRDCNVGNLLHHSCYRGYKELIEELVLKQKMNINNREEEGKTPLMMAAWVGRVGAVTFLLTQPNIDIDARDANGYTGTLPCSSLLALGTRPHQAWGKPPSLWTLSRVATW